MTTAMRWSGAGHAVRALWFGFNGVMLLWAVDSAAQFAGSGTAAGMVDGALGLVITAVMWVGGSALLGAVLALLTRPAAPEDFSVIARPDDGFVPAPRRGPRAAVR